MGDPRSVRRQEDLRFVTGHGQFVDDRIEGTRLYAAFLRSPHAHANIISLNTVSAAALPGIHGVYTANDVLKSPSNPHGLGPLQHQSLSVLRHN